MLRSILILMVLLATSFSGRAQMPFYHYFQDTIRPGYRISGSFDSIDTKLSLYQSTMPTFWRPALEPFDLSRTYVSDPVVLPVRRFSSIPHVGLRYSFGTNLSQQGGISYTQALTSNQFIQLDYTRTSSNGAIRNAAFERNWVGMTHLFRGKYYASDAELVFQGSTRGVNGGLIGDTLTDETLPLEFQDVHKANATITQRHFHIDWKNFISFTGDSLIKTGVYIAPHYRIDNRRFQEDDTIGQIYGFFNYDTLQTNDYWERSEIGTTAGYFFHTPHFAINGGLKMAYWDFDNLIRKSDTTEVGIVSDLVIDLFDAVRLQAAGSYTFVGAAGEKKLSALLSYTHAFADLNVKFLFNQSFPTNYQRAYYGNVLDYSWQNKTLISTTKLDASVRFKRKWLPVTAGASFTNVLNNPFFTGTVWRQDTLTNLSFVQTFVRANLKWKKLFFQPAVRFQSSTFGGFVPATQLSARIGFDGYLFKAKKLRATFGIDAGYTSAFTLLDYVPVMDTYVLPDTSRSYTAMPKLHAFTQFELGFFRWFIRVENIEQTFVARPVNQEALGYPVVPLQLRIGLSWDLFN